MRLIVFLIIILQISQIGNSQLSSKSDIFFGYGFYEGYNVGGEYYFKTGIHSMSLSLGYDRLINKNNNQESLSFALAYNHAILRNHTNRTDNFKWSLSNRIVLWQLEDNYYLWRAISLIPSISRRFIISKNINLSIDAGPSFNIVLYNSRKTFKEVGWPYHVMPNCRVLFII